jgi:hypothetical protein
MKRVLPITAMITSMLASPGMVPAPVHAQVQTPAVEAFPAEMPATVAEKMRRVARGEPLDAYGMQTLRRRIALNMERQLADLAKESRRYRWIQVSAPAQGGENLLIPAPAPRTEKATFLGIVASPAAATLREEMKLPRGVGLVVEYVDAGSPAEKAGVKKGDVLQKLDDQVLINGPQLAVLVRDKKPGDVVKLTALRGGEINRSQVVEVTLGEKDLPVLEDSAPALGMLDNGAVGGGLSRGSELQVPAGQWVGTAVHIDADGTIWFRAADEQYDITLQRTKSGNESIAAKDREGRVLYEGPSDKTALSRLAPELQKRIENALSNPARIRTANPATQGGVTTNRTLVMNRKDEQHDITLHLVNGDRQLTVKDLATGKILFDGPANTADDLKKLSPAVQPKVQQMLEKVK